MGNSICNFVLFYSATTTNVETIGLKVALDEILATLPQMERRTVEQYFGLSSGSSKTIKEVSIELKVTPEQADENLINAFHKMRHPSRSRKLLPFITQSK